MKDYLKVYDVVLHTKGPVFVGSGNEIGKKEYIFTDKKTVGIFDIGKLYAFLTKKGKAAEFEKYMLDSRDSLSNWFRKQNINTKEVEPFIKYRLDCGDAIIEGGNRLQIMEGVKDSYGLPYIPGSSLKGMFRTILLSEDILVKGHNYSQNASDIERTALEPARGKINRTTFLKREEGELEGKEFLTLKKDERKPENAVNDWMQGFVVSDSEPLSQSDLVLCQKIEVHTDGKQTKLNLLRECIKPGTDIHFTITCDTTVCPLDDKTIMEAVRVFADSYYENFSSGFKGTDRPSKDTIYLGGGAGFVSKTAVYPLFGKKKGIEVTKAIYDKTGVPKEHLHYKDANYGVSPHILKCTQYKGKLVEMGKCRIEITRRV